MAFVGKPRGHDRPLATAGTTAAPRRDVHGVGYTQPRMPTP